MTPAPDLTVRRSIRRLRPPHLSKENRQVWSVLLGAAVAQLGGSHLVGNTIGAVAWAALAGGLLAYLGTTSKRGPLLVAAIVAVAGSHTLFGVLLALLAVLAAFLSTAHVHRRAVFARGAAGGLTLTAVLVSAGHRSAWLTCVVAILALGTIATSGYRNATERVRRTLRWSALGAATFAGLATAAAVVAVASQVDDVDFATAELRFGLAAARAGDAPLAERHLASAAALAGDAEATIDRLSAPARIVPFVSQHVTALVGVLGGAEAVADQASVTAGLASSDRLAVTSGRIEVRAVADLEAPLRRLAVRLGELADEVDDHLRSPLLPVLSDRLETLGIEAQRSHAEAELGARAAAVMPRMLGADAPQRYLVLFTSPAEARGRFGFPGSFAEVTFDDGRFLLGEQGASSQVFHNERFDQSRFDILHDEQLSPYVSYGVTHTVLSATIPPDFATVAKVVAEQWRQSGRKPLDGVVRMDPTSLAPLLAFTGPVAVGGVPEPISARNVEQFLLFDQYLQFPVDQAPRREVLDTVADVTFERLVSAELPPPRALVQAFAPVVRAGHLDVVAFDDDAERMLDRAGLAGGFEAESPDELALMTVNNVGNKIDSFLTTSVRYRAEVDDGQLTGAITIGATNGAPARGLPEYVIGSSTKPPLPKGTNRATLMLFTRVQPTGVTVDGEERVARVEVVGGDRYLTQVPVLLAPGQSIEVEVRLDGALPGGTGDYALRLLPGGTSVPTTYNVRVVRHNSTPLRYVGRVRSPRRVG